VRTFTRILEKNGYATHKAMSAEEALAKLTENSYDVTLIDIRIPDGNGIDLLSKMPEKNRNIVKIVITGSPTTQNRCDAAENGADAYLEKPIKPEQLLSVIAENLMKKRIR
jgi:DNA-binding NtrC family response regulator